MTISTLSLAWSLWLAVAVAVCAAVLIHNVRREIRPCPQGRTGRLKPRPRESLALNRSSRPRPITGCIPKIPRAKAKKLISKRSVPYEASENYL